MEAGQIKTVIERALVSFTGQTTGAGNVGGTTLVCSSLTTRANYDGQKALIADGSYAGQVRDIDGATTGGTVTVTPALGGQIVAGVNFYIIADLPMTEEAALITAELAKVPKSDAAVSWNATALAAINTEVDTALNTAIPGAPTADSINERVKTLDDAYTAARAVFLDELAAANIPADTDSKVMGRLQIKATTIDLNQVAATYPLFTGTAQAVILESLNIKMPNLAAGGALTSISIQTDDVTPGVIISVAQGAVANLTAEADLSWTGSLYITVATIITLTIAEKAHGAAYVCNIACCYRAVVSGGNLA